MAHEPSWAEADVLHFDPRRHAPADRHRYVLVPAWATRIHARRRQAEPLNPLQRAVLGLCAAGVRTLDAVGGHLGLDRQLVGFIALQLDDRGLLDRGRLAPTPHGHEALAGALAAAEEAVVAHVFQDPWSGELLPTCAATLARCDAVHAGQRRFALTVGSRGEPRRVQAMVLPPPDAPPPPAPDTGSILPLLREASYDHELTAGGQARDHVRKARPRFSRLSIVDVPRLVLLATCAYTPRNADDGAGWFVADPFGGEPDARLWRLLHTRMGEDERLARWLEPVVARAAAASAPAEPLAAPLRTVAARLGPHPAGGPEVADALARMEAACAREARDDARGPEHGAAVRARGAAAVAELLRALARAFATDGLALTLPQRDREHRDGLVRQAAARAGSGAVPAELLQVGPEELAEACDHHEGALPALLLAAVLAAGRNPAHPLRLALDACPALLGRIVALELAGEQRAAGARPHRSRLEAARRAVYEIVSAFAPWDQPAPASTPSASP